MCIYYKLQSSVPLPIHNRWLTIVLPSSVQPLITTPNAVVSQAVGYRIELQCMAEAKPTPADSDVAWTFGVTTYTVNSDRLADLFTSTLKYNVTLRLVTRYNSK